MQYFKKDMKKKYFKFKNFRLPREQPPETLNLPPANLTRGGQVGNCLFLTLRNKVNKLRTFSILDENEYFGSY